VNAAKDSPVRCWCYLGTCLPWRRSVRFLVLAALLPASCISPCGVFAQDTPPKSTDRISGTVVNGVTHEPVGHALVLSPDERFATMTDSDGRFEFIFSQSDSGQGTAGSITPGVSAGFNGNTRPYALTARKPGFLSDTGNPQQTLQGMQSGQDITVPLVPEALIVGHVALPTSQPPDNIQVQLYRRQVQNGRARWTQTGTETTRSNGDFRFAELSAGSYKVLTRESLDRDPQASAPGGQMYGYAPVYFPNARDFAAAATIQLTPGKIVHVDLSLVRQPYYPIKLPVANAPPGAPLGVDVTVQGRGGPGYSLGYESREQAITGLLPSGSYRLEVVSYGPVSVSGSLNVTVNGPLEGPVLIVAPNSPISVHVREEFTSSEREAVVPGSGSGSNFSPRGPVRDVNVSLEAVDDIDLHRGFGLRSPSGPEDDSLVVENVQPGRYWVRVYASRGYVASLISGGVDLLREPLVVPSGSSVAPIEVTLRDDSAQLEGTIEGAKTSSARYTGAAEGTSQPAVQGAQANARVYCVPLPGSPGRFTEVYVNPDGSFTAPPLPPGEYRLLAFSHPQPELEYENAEAMRAYDGKGQIVRLSAGQKQKIQLQLISPDE
jgi:hypothetical protein